MTRRVAAALIGLALLGFAGSLAAQDTLDRRDPTAALSAQFLAAAAEAKLMAGTPNGHHRALDPLVGEWLTEVHVWPEGAEEPETSRGSLTYRWIMDGRFLLEEMYSDRDGRAQEGLALIGYNNVSGEYEGARVDNTNTFMLFQDGMMSPNGELSWRSGYREPVSGSWIEVLTIHTIVDDDTMRVETYEGATSPDRKVMEVIAKRISG